MFGARDRSWLLGSLRRFPSLYYRRSRGQRYRIPGQVLLLWGRRAWIAAPARALRRGARRATEGLLLEQLWDRGCRDPHGRISNPHVGTALSWLSGGWLTDHVLISQPMQALPRRDSGRHTAQHTAGTSLGGVLVAMSVHVHESRSAPPVRYGAGLRVRMLRQHPYPERCKGGRSVGSSRRLFLASSRFNLFAPVARHQIRVERQFLAPSVCQSVDAVTDLQEPFVVVVGQYRAGLGTGPHLL